MLCIEYLKGVVDGAADGMGGQAIGDIINVGVYYYTLAGGVLGLLACGLGMVLGSVGFCKGVCMGMGMLDIG